MNTTEIVSTNTQTANAEEFQKRCTSRDLKRPNRERGSIGTIITRCENEVEVDTVHVCPVLRGRWKPAISEIVVFLSSRPRSMGHVVVVKEGNRRSAFSCTGSEGSHLLVISESNSGHLMEQFIFDLQQNHTSRRVGRPFVVSDNGKNVPVVVVLILCQPGIKFFHEVPLQMADAYIPLRKKPSWESSALGLSAYIRSRRCNYEELQLFAKIEQFLDISGAITNERILRRAVITPMEVKPDRIEPQRLHLQQDSLPSGFIRNSPILKLPRYNDSRLSVDEHTLTRPIHLGSILLSIVLRRLGAGISRDEYILHGFLPERQQNENGDSSPEKEPRSATNPVTHFLLQTLW
mmetsp:Transcript_24807/g.98053  ORF Transcript_24807/g.98053 Transcript_24807/m.98053 type:complete len:349 (+) Transcript_24807:2985-4031(+)